MTSKSTAYLEQEREQLQDDLDNESNPEMRIEIENALHENRVELEYNELNGEP